MKITEFSRKIKFFTENDQIHEKCHGREIVNLRLFPTEETTFSLFHGYIFSSAITNVRSTVAVIQLYDDDLDHLFDAA